MANRLFLTLLALMTGLAAQIGPAQARVNAAAGAEIGAVATFAVAKASSVAAVQVRREFGGRGRADTEQGLEPVQAADFAPLSVLTGIDRARE